MQTKDFVSILNHNCFRKGVKCTMTESLLLTIRYDRMEIELEKIMKNHKEYQAAKQEAEELLNDILKQFEKQPEHYAAINELVAAYNHVGFVHADLAYQLGFEDAIKIIAELHEMGNNKQE